MPGGESAGGNCPGVKCPVTVLSGLTSTNISPKKSKSWDDFSTSKKNDMDWIVL